MYLRTTRRRNSDGSDVRYLSLAHNEWDATAGRSKVRILFNFGREDGHNSAVARVLNPWVAAARAAEKTLIVAHHQRKGGGENGEGIAGGHAILGIFDIALEVLRDPQAHQSNRRLVRAYARLISPSELLYERAEDGSLRALGNPGAVRLDDVQDRLLGVLTHDHQTTKACHEDLGEPRPSLEQVRLALLALARVGRVTRDPTLDIGDARGRTIRWALASAEEETSNARSSRVELNLAASQPPDPTRRLTIPPDDGELGAWFGPPLRGDGADADERGTV